MGTGEVSPFILNFLIYCPVRFLSVVTSAFIPNTPDMLLRDIKLKRCDRTGIGEIFLLPEYESVLVRTEEI